MHISPWVTGIRLSQLPSHASECCRKPTITTSTSGRLMKNFQVSWQKLQMLNASPVLQTCCFLSASVTWPHSSESSRALLNSLLAHVVREVVQGYRQMSAVHIIQQPGLFRGNNLCLPKTTFKIQVITRVLLRVESLCCKVTSSQILQDQQQEDPDL